MKALTWCLAFVPRLTNHHRHYCETLTGGQYIRQNETWSLRLVSILNITTADILPLPASVPMIPEFRYGNVKADVECERTSKDGGNKNAIALNYRVVESVGKGHGV